MSGRKLLYAAFCVIGTALPYSQLVPFLLANGIDVTLFIELLFANRISGFFAWDVITSACVLWAFVVLDGRRSRVSHLWLPLAATVVVGVSLGLPLFLYLREGALESLRSAI